MDRAGLLTHLRATHFGSGDRERALADARRIAGYLQDRLPATISTFRCHIEAFASWMLGQSET